MSQAKLLNILLSFIAFVLVVIAVHLVLEPRTVAAQSNFGDRLFIEPGVQMLHAPDGSRNVYGKVIVDLQTGKVWGFPTPTGNPYPMNPVSTKPEISHPFLLGRFAVEDLDK